MEIRQPLILRLTVLVEERTMRVYSYVVKRDFGFAPNPFYACCTLATCKPKIRKNAHVGDIIVGIGSGAQNSVYKNRMIFAMIVSEILTFDEYWNDLRFQIKKPYMGGSKKQMYGDNIYHTSSETGEMVQEYSHHSYEDGSTNYNNFNRDVPGEKVLIAEQYWYFGNQAIEIPTSLLQLSDVKRAHRAWDDVGFYQKVKTWLENLNQAGQIGMPCKFSEPYQWYEGE